MIEHNLKPTNQRTIIANTPANGYSFTGWTGDIQHLANPALATTVVTMPDADVHVVAGYLLNSVTIVKYGYLYNLYAVKDSKIITSEGWRVPTQGEYTTLINFLGGRSIAGGAVKDISLDYWNSPNTGATNSAKLNLRGLSERYSGIFDPLKFYCRLWTSTPYLTIHGYGVRLHTNSTLFEDDNLGTADRGRGLRLIRDYTTLTHGQVGSYTGNDGKVYATICIGTQEWVSSNLAETKYRDGSIIPTVTDNATWAALTTGAKCAYDNLESNV